MASSIIQKLFILIFVGLSFACTKDESGDDGGIHSQISSVTLCQSASSDDLYFTANSPWTAELPQDCQWCTISPRSGDGSGQQAIKIQASSNSSKTDRSTIIKINTLTGSKEIFVLQVGTEQLLLEKTEFVFASKGGQVEFTVESNVRLRIKVPTNCYSWIKRLETSSPAEIRGVTVQKFALNILPNTTEQDKSGYFSLYGLSEDRMIPVRVVGTMSELNHTSDDYSADGKVIPIQKASKGKGINIILMGDAFTDRQIANGTYERIMRKAADAFFTIEPYNSFRDMFNVYAVVTVSPNTGYFEGAQPILKTYFGKNTKVGGDNNICLQYAMKIPGMTADKLNESLVIVMMNSKRYAGTCYMFFPEGRNDYGQGKAIAYFPLGTSDEMFIELLHHEAGGHGFAKLSDEYVNNNSGMIPQSEIEGLHHQEDFGWAKNIDFTDDPSAVKWSRFLTDTRYSQDNLGIFMGAATYIIGVYRPTNNSIMNTNKGIFNAPSREAIYYRIHKLSEGVSWTYDYEKFAQYDQINRNSNEDSAFRHDAETTAFEPLHPPVVLPYGQ